MADTTHEPPDAIPAPPFPDLGQCTSGELSTYEASLRGVLAASRNAADRLTVIHALEDVAGQWVTRAKITPGKAGRTWPIN